ncbi:MAG: hypothetical protein J0I10_11740 [Verrucomicrobia bacterium]|nr:hypothetical protein [Verrucomicrobiota bacterium]
MYLRQTSVWLVLLAAAVILSGCAATQTFTPETAPDYVMIRDYTPFYRLGPMQGRPDASLPSGTRVKLLRQEMGYSLVQLSDSRTGYVANENMAPAPPLPPSVTGSDSSDTPRSGKKRRNVPDSPRYTGEQMNDIPMPEPNTPAPDLNIAPEDVAAPAPTPTPPAEKPKFRY